MRSKKFNFFCERVKLLANSTYGKFGQSPLNYTFAKICFKKSHFKKSINSDRFLQASIVKKDIAIVEFKPKEMMFDAPFSIAATILDLSKLYMYNYYYNILQPTFYPDKVNIILHDTDSFIFEVNCNLFFEKYKKCLIWSSVILKKITIFILIKTEKHYYILKMKRPPIS